MAETLLEKTESLESALIQSLDSSNLRDLTVDLAEVGIDQLLDDGLVRDVPILGTLARLRATIGIVRDHLFARKVAKFLVGVAKIDAAERKRFITEIRERDEDKRLGETLVLLLDRLDDFQKPELLARMFRAYVKGQCDLSMFRRLAAVVDQLPLPSLRALRSFYSTTRGGLFETGGEFLSQFAALGLAAIEFYPSDTGLVGGSYNKTELGKLFVAFLEEAT
jgi:hypothetical protein